MPSVVLPYDRNIVRQDTFFNCGPASTQIVLNSRGIFVDEGTLARELGTTSNGTDYIGLIERVLDARVPQANYTTVQMQNDPPSPAQVERLWQDIQRSINAGWGAVCNIAAPPSNYPRGANGSVSPSYGGGLVLHYFAAMGYEDVGRGRFVWIADSGFAPFGYWISLEQLASLIPPKGYCYANVAPAVDADGAVWADNLRQLLGP